MALTDVELAAVKRELGFNVLAVGAEPYIGVAALFESVIAPNLTPEGEEVVRGILEELANVATEISNARTRVGVKQVDDIQFFGGARDGKDPLEQLIKLREYHRNELASVLGIARPNAGGSDAAIY